MTLYLLPNLLGPVENPSEFLPASINEAMLQIDGLIAESEGEGRRYLKRFSLKKPPYQIPIALMKDDSDFLLEPLLKGENWGLVSDAGLPCLADPGAMIVRKAYSLKIHVKAFVGPSSITLALMQSGLSGQEFYFHGYLPKQNQDSALKTWEKTSKVTHIFIETPYRNNAAIKACLETLHETTLLCVASNLTLPDQFIKTAPISYWKKNPIELPKQPAIFLFLSL